VALQSFMMHDEIYTIYILYVLKEEFYTIYKSSPKS